MSETSVSGEAIPEDNKAEHPTITYMLGMEFYKNESEKEMDGLKLLEIEVPSNVDQTELTTQMSALILQHSEAAEKIHASMLANRTELEADGIVIPDISMVHASVWSNSKRGGRERIAEVIKRNEYWFHLFIKEEMARQRKSMFEKTEAEQAEQFHEPSLDDVLGETSNKPDVNLDAGGLTLTMNHYFSKSGKLLNGLPDFWMIQSGLL